ncbi:hypothetical protein AADG42_16905 [Ammonicoccus fulvus]|uniref:Uncharacterized protein n=1 Tax=Ammonicoccus fulvus TaxID=3138240 RepID=A0ABZ3FWG6_9ACTN
MSHPAERVIVVTDEGNHYPGWVILDDIVLVRNLRRTDFCPTVRVEVEGRELGVLDRINSAPAPGRNRSGVALVLAAGSLSVGGEALPPDATPGPWAVEFPGLAST